MTRTKEITRGYKSWSQPFLKAAKMATAFPFSRKLLLAWSEKKLLQVMVEKNPEIRSRAAKLESYFMVRAVLRSIARTLDGRGFSDHVKDVILRVFLRDVLMGDAPRRKTYIEKYGLAPPTFLTISPYKGCNLRCRGCYAASEGRHDNTLEFSILQKILDQAKDLWGSRFFVISGGEPLLYKSEGKTILDLFEANRDSYFLMYTNGTLIDKETARRLEAAGNATPAVSIEGFREETDARRGRGVFDKILAAVDMLRKEGVPFGFSGTITRENVGSFLDERLVRYYFHELGGVYMWLFHYMPIGRDISVDFQPTPEQRKALFLKQREWIRQGYFLVDFWNDGIVTDGCICAGRPGGYFYIDWDGNVMPCVFVPYSTHNIKEVFDRGGDLNDVLRSPFLKDMRRWQRDYSYMKGTVREIGNQIRCCPIRDHHAAFREILERNGGRPTDANAAQALEDPEYMRKMVDYDRKLAEQTDPIWEKEYREVEGEGEAPRNRAGAVSASSRGTESVHEAGPFPRGEAS